MKKIQGFLVKNLLSLLLISSNVGAIRAEVAAIAAKDNMAVVPANTSKALVPVKKTTSEQSTSITDRTVVLRNMGSIQESTMEDAENLITEMVLLVLETFNNRKEKNAKKCAQALKKSLGSITVLDIAKVDKQRKDVNFNGTITIDTLVPHLVCIIDDVVSNLLGFIPGTLLVKTIDCFFKIAPEVKDKENLDLTIISKKLGVSEVKFDKKVLESTSLSISADEAIAMFKKNYLKNMLDNTDKHVRFDFKGYEISKEVKGILKEKPSKPNTVLIYNFVKNHQEFVSENPGLTELFSKMMAAKKSVLLKDLHIYFVSLLLGIYKEHAIRNNLDIVDLENAYMQDSNFFANATDFLITKINKDVFTDLLDLLFELAGANAANNFSTLLSIIYSLIDAHKNKTTPAVNDQTTKQYLNKFTNYDNFTKDMFVSAMDAMDNVQDEDVERDIFSDKAKATGKIKIKELLGKVNFSKGKLFKTNKKSLTDEEDEEREDQYEEDENIDTPKASKNKLIRKRKKTSDEDEMDAVPAERDEPPVSNKAKRNRQTAEAPPIVKEAPEDFERENSNQQPSSEPDRPAVNKKAEFAKISDVTGYMFLPTSPRDDNTIYKLCGGKIKDNNILITTLSELKTKMSTFSAGNKLHSINVYQNRSIYHDYVGLSLKKPNDLFDLSDKALLETFETLHILGEGSEVLNGKDINSFNVNDVDFMNQKVICLVTDNGNLLFTFLSRQTSHNSWQNYDPGVVLLSGIRSAPISGQLDSGFLDILNTIKKERNLI